MAELGPRGLLAHAVDLDVQLLVVEGDQAGYLLALRQGSRVGPGEILVQHLADSHAPGLGPPLVRAVGDGRRALEQVHPVRVAPAVRSGPCSARVLRAWGRPSPCSSTRPSP